MGCSEVEGVEDWKNCECGSHGSRVLDGGTDLAAAAA